MEFHLVPSFNSTPSHVEVVLLLEAMVRELVTLGHANPIRLTPRPNYLIATLALILPALARNSDRFYEVKIDECAHWC
jgi:hypothetical protein